MINKITINNKDFTVDELEAMIQKAKQPKRLTWSNGAEIEAPENGTEYYSITNEGGIIESYNYNHYNKSIHKYNLEHKNLFLQKETAERYKDYVETHNRLLKKIIEINAENNWVADWNNGDQHKYCLTWNNFTESTSYQCSYREQSFSIFMSEQAKNYMMSYQVPIQDFKKFLFIYE